VSKPLDPRFHDGSRTSQAKGAERSSYGVVKTVVASGSSVAYDNNRGKIAKANELKYVIEVVVNGTVIAFPAASPAQPRPAYKVYSARTNDPCRCYWLGKTLAFQVEEAPYGGSC
jgi:hypothetical protein